VLDKQAPTQHTFVGRTTPLGVFPLKESHKCVICCKKEQEHVKIEKEVKTGIPVYFDDLEQS